MVFVCFESMWKEGYRLSPEGSPLPALRPPYPGGGRNRLSGTFFLPLPPPGETVSSFPLSGFPDCLKFSVRKEYGSTTHETYTLWFAKDVGTVRSEKVTVNYGEERERVVDALR